MCDLIKCSYFRNFLKYTPISVKYYKREVISVSLSVCLSMCTIVFELCNDVGSNITIG